MSAGTESGKRGKAPKTAHGKVPLWQTEIRFRLLSQKNMRSAIPKIDFYFDFNRIAFMLSDFFIGVDKSNLRKCCRSEREEKNMKKTVFTGAATAIITPMNETGVDYETFARLIDWQIDSGIDAIVAAGTTGEGSTLSDEEHREVLKFVINHTAKRVPVIAGTGSNDIAYAIDLTKFACDAGADAMLVVTPYYNKATQGGLIKSFSAIADASTKPIIMYNVPSRTGCNIAPETCAVLCEHPNITAVKEACGDISHVAKTAALTKGKLDIYSGNDDQIVPIMSLGGKGVISVLSNILPRETSDMCKYYLQGDVKKSAEMQLKYLELINALFCEVNPIPIKAAMAKMGFGENRLRLPLTQMEEQNAEKLYTIMRNLGIIE